MRVLVAGGGAIGSAVALAVQRAGAMVVLADPAPLGDNASGVAAGMLAPAFEAVLDPVSAGHFELLREARDWWPSFAASLGEAPPIDRSGAVWVAADPDDRAKMLQRLLSAGARAEAISPDEAADRSAGVAAAAGGAFTSEDWRLDPIGMLTAIRAALAREGGELRRAAVTDFGGGVAQLSDGEWAADAVVLASGLAPAGFAASPAETGVLAPIKGQILKAHQSAPTSGPVMRGPGVYVVPGEGGPWIGATMEPGVSDRRIDAQTTAALAAKAAALFPHLAQAGMRAFAGVRAATPDGLPLVGQSSRPGVFLAMGARRNGWLLAPMIADLIVDALAGKAAPARFDPRRFDLARAI